jgi:hypothetical protein
MSLEGTIRDLGLQEIGQLLALGRKSGVLQVHSRLRATRAWIRFVDGAMVDAGRGGVLPEGEATDAARAGDRRTVEEAVQDVLAWREGSFGFTPAITRGAGQSAVRIPADAMLVESARREEVWQRIRDRVPSADAIPSFVDVEPKALPLLRLVPLQWEVLTQVDGSRDLQTLARLLQRDLIEVAEVVHGLVETGLLTVRDGALALRPTPLGMPAVLEPLPLDSPSGTTPSSPPPPMLESLGAADEEADPDADDLWIPGTAELAPFLGDAEAPVFDPRREGLVTRHGTPVVSAAPAPPVPDADTAAITRPASPAVASAPVEPSTTGSWPAEVSGALRAAGDAAARRGDFGVALACWTRYLDAFPSAPDADRVREAAALVTRLTALLDPPAAR